MRLYVPYHKKALPSKKIRFHRAATLSKSFQMKDTPSIHSFLKEPDYLLSKKVCVEAALDFGQVRSRVNFRGGPLFFAPHEAVEHPFYSSENSIVCAKANFPSVDRDTVFQAPALNIYSLFPLFFALLKKLS